MDTEEKLADSEAHRGRPRRQPSGRNLELYYELVCRTRQQVEVAARFRVSQPRVCQIRDEVASWVESMSVMLKDLNGVKLFATHLDPQVRG